MAHISEAARLTGIPATTIRYYEDTGLLRRARRTSGGYRSYDARDLARLRFVSRARRLALPTDDLRELIEAWDSDDCPAVADRMRQQVAARLAETEQQLADLAELRTELRTTLDRLQDDPPHPGPCIEDDCVCFDSGSDTPSTTQPAPVGALTCTLEAHALPQRIAAWRNLLAHAEGYEPTDRGVTVRFHSDPALAAELVAVAAAEHACCSFFGFALRITADALHLDVTAPVDAAPLLAELLGERS